MSLIDARLDATLDQVTTVAGTARQAMLGAVVLTADRTPVYIAGLPEWDDDRSGEPIEVTGLLRRRSLAPDPTVDEDGAVSHGIEGTQYVLDDATWENSEPPAAPPKMATYFFVYDRTTNLYLRRYWVRSDDASDADAPPMVDQLDGVLDEDGAETLLETMRHQYPEPRYAVALMSATSWKTVEENFPSLYDR